MNVLGKKKLRWFSWTALSTAALLYLFVFAIPLSSLPRYIVACFVAHMFAFAIAIADQFLSSRPTA